MADNETELKSEALDVTSERDEKSSIVFAEADSHSVISRRRPSDADAQTILIDSLRSQINDLFTQVTQLNNKLVQSYDRVSILEDNLHIASSSVRSQSVKISHLELERSQHLSALNTGLLVEKSHVTTELTRLMEKATEEAARRGQAESARADIEKELDDLSANLFDQANNMVAEARFARAQSERKVEISEAALKGAEEAVALMQAQLQSLQSDRRPVEVLLGQSIASGLTLQLMSSHTPYQEFLTFLVHLRSLRSTTYHAPAMSSLLTERFIARLITEDSDPTVRLDLAPSLNWITRRSVLSAIHSGQLIIEPMSTANLKLEFSYTTSGTNPGMHSTISCALCGSVIIPGPEVPPPPSHPATVARTGAAVVNAWSSFRTLSNSGTPQPHPQHPSPPLTPPPATHNLLDHPTQIHVFRLAQAAQSPLGLPNGVSANRSPATSTATPYPLCASGWCLTRLRSTCSMWAFVRGGVVEKIWEEPVPPSPAPVIHSPAPQKAIAPTTTAASPSKRRTAKLSGGLGSLWGAFSGNGPKTPEKEKVVERKLPPPPAPAPAAASTVPPTLVAKVAAPPVTIVPPARSRPVTPAGASPPPLPKRASNRVSLLFEHKSDGEEDAPLSSSKPPTLPATTEEEKFIVEESTSEVPAPVTAAAILPAPQSHPAEASVLTPPSEEPPVVTALQASEVPVMQEDAEKILNSQAPASTPVSESTSEPLAPASAPGTSAETTIPSETTLTPAPVVEAAKVPPVKSKTDGSATAAVPPPVPRRAAARRPAPVPQTAPAAPVPAPATVESTPPASIEKDMATPVPEVSSAPETTDETPAVAVAADTPAATILTPSDDPTVLAAVENSSNAIDTQPPIGTSDNAVPEAEAVDPVVLPTTIVSEPTSSPPDAPPESTPASAPAQTVAEALASANAAKSEPEAPSAEALAALAAVKKTPVFDENAHLYIGNVTWEERTWKELSRLREDMFWARIGGVKVESTA